MNGMRLYLVASFLFVLSANFGFAQNRCTGGGDGGTPFSVISKEISQSPNILKTSYLVKDFQIFERRGLFLYRSEISDFRSHDLSTGRELSYGESTMNLSRLMDPGERFLVSENGMYFLDGQGNHAWKKIPYPVEVSKHAFWHKGSLYSIAKPRYDGLQQIVEIYNYTPDQDRVRSCKLKSAFGNEFYISQGHAYPYIYLYRQNKEANGYKLHVYRVNLTAGFFQSKCEIESVTAYADPMPGPVIAMHHFPQLQGNIIQIDHPKKNLLWDKGADECFFYDMQGRSPMILGRHFPLVATWKAGEGLGLLYPRVSKAAVMKKSGHFDLSEKNLWLSSRDNQLYVAERVSAESENRLVFHFETDNLVGR